MINYASVRIEIAHMLLIMSHGFSDRFYSILLGLCIAYTKWWFVEDVVSSEDVVCLQSFIFNIQKRARKEFASFHTPIKTTILEQQPSSK